MKREIITHAFARVVRARVALAIVFVTAVVAFAIAVVCDQPSSPRIRFTAGGPKPAVGLYWYDDADPTTGPGMSAPLDQLLVRTDAPSIYYKSGATNTAWTRIGQGTSSGGSVTSIACGTGLSCSPSSPITTAGTINVSLTTTTCAAGSAEITTAANGTSTCALFVNAATGSGGLALTGSSLGLITSCSSGQVLAWNGTAWACATPIAVDTSISSTHSYLSDEFENAGDNTFTPLWSTGGTGVDSTATGTANHPGIRELCTTATRKSIQAGAGNFDTWIPGGGIADQEWDVRLPVLSNGTDTYIAYFGTTTTVADVPSRGIYCKADIATSLNWQGCTTQASSSTCADTSPIVPIVANDWTHCTWEVNAAGTSVAFTIKDITAAVTGTVVSASNIPTGVSTPAAYLIKSAGVTSRCIDMDYYWMAQAFTTPR